MPTIQVHDDGWLALPAEVRQHLALTTGSRLDVEFADGALVLRPAKQATAVAPEPDVAASAPVEPEMVEAKAEPDEAAAEAETSKRGPRRPRKTIAQDLAPRIKVGGRRKSTVPA